MSGRTTSPSEDYFRKEEKLPVGGLAVGNGWERVLSRLPIPIITQSAVESQGKLRSGRYTMLSKDDLVKTMRNLGKSDAEIEATLRSWESLAAHNGGNGHSPATGQRYPPTDLGNAERFVERHGENVRFCHTWQEWLIYDGRRWKLDQFGEIFQRAKETVRAMYAEASEIADDQARKLLVNHAQRSESEGHLRAMVTLAQSDPSVAVISKQFDANPWQLNVLNGTLDLHSGHLHPHARNDLITKLAPVRYDPTATLDTWDLFLDSAIDGDHEKKEFLQRAAGYSLSGSTREEVLFLVLGPAATGKSTFLEALRSILGDYAMTADFETFLQRNMVGGIRNDIARLEGARFVVSIEVDKGKRLAEGLIKTIVGGDTVSARFLYREAFEFLPQFKLWLAANDPPQVSDRDEAMWRRIVRIPFEHVIPKTDRNPKVKQTLRDPQIAGPAILNWALKGCLDWQKSGLDVPAIIEEATSTLRRDMDPLRDFFADYCEFGPDFQVAAGDLRSAYEKWVQGNGEMHAVSARDFAERLRSRGCIDDRKGRDRHRIWLGVGLKAEGDS